MSTLRYVENDTSAVGRLVVWRWTLDYVSQRPLGGGRKHICERASAIGIPESDEATLRDTRPKAFQVFFSNCSGHGYPGLCLFLLTVTIIIGAC